MIKKFKELDKYQKILVIIFFLAVLAFLKIGLMKIGLTYLFIKDYPEKEQETRLKVISFINLYEPYIAPYNYGNYYYQKGLYNEAYQKYSDALTHKIPDNRICKVHINASLALIKLSELEVDDEEKLLLLTRAQSHLELCKGAGGGGGDGGGGDQGDDQGENKDNGGEGTELGDDKKNAKQLEDAIAQQKDEIGKNQTPHKDPNSDKKDQNDNKETDSQKDTPAQASPNIKKVEEQSNKGTDKRDQLFQEQSYQNRGQYGAETPGSGCIGACW